MKKLLLSVILIISITSYLPAEDMIDDNFWDITQTNQVEYNGEAVKLFFSGIKPIAGNEEKGSVLSYGQPLFVSVASHSPWVIKDQGIYKMWFGGQYLGIIRIGYATSYDGISWTVYSNTSSPDLLGAVIGPENAPLCCSKFSRYPCVIKEGDLYKMWFEAYDNTDYRIAYATSYDGISWTVYSNTSSPDLLGAVFSEKDLPVFASNQISSPTVIRDGTGYKMWFKGSDAVRNRIGYAASSDGLSWTVYSNQTDPDLFGAVIGWENTPDFCIGQVNFPGVIKDGLIYKMLFMGGDGVILRCGYAFSYDGLNWTAYSNEANVKGCFFNPGYPDFASYNIWRYSIINDSGQYKVWYQGYDGSTSRRIGYGLITFFQSGSFTSRIIDAGHPVSLKKLYFNADLPADTYLKFQVRTGRTRAELRSALFKGPRQQTDTYYTVNGEDMQDIRDIQYLQYKAWLSTEDDTVSPELHMVKFSSDSLYEGTADDRVLCIIPNPYKPDENNLSIKYLLEEAADVEIRIYTREGREVWNTEAAGNKGWNITEWNGKDKDGRTAGSGVYLCVIKKKYPDTDKLVKNTILLVR